jgi:2-polyprenyl-3-methyl-5-hydroxy-6-metoxy-1,4-benzoquinol methylase
MRKALFHLWQSIRFRYCLQLLDKRGRTLLDVGCGNGKFAAMARKNGFNVQATDAEEDIAETRRTADIITCFEVLEHLPNPVKAIQNLSRLYRRQLIISVPYEPWFSLWRLSWEKEHLWAVTPVALRLHLGPPAFEAVILFKRYYVAYWLKDESREVGNSPGRSA